MFIRVHPRPKKFGDRGGFETRPYPLKFGVNSDKALFLTLGTLGTRNFRHFLIRVHLYYLRSNSENFVKQNDVGAAPCGRPQDGQPQGVAPTISANNAGFPSVWLRRSRAALLTLNF